MTRILALIISLWLVPLFGADAEWPVNGGPYNIRYTELTQITPANVGRLQVAWSWDAHEAFKDSEMQSNPIVVDGVLYATTPKMHVIALDARYGARNVELRSQPRRHRPAPLPASRRDASIKTASSSPTAIYCGRSTARPASQSRSSATTATSICARASTGQIESLSVSASSPGVIFEDMIILG